MDAYLYELKTPGARVFVMPSGALGIERGGIVTILPPAEWHDRVNAWLAEHHSAMAARREGNEIVGGMLAELRAQLATARQHDADQRAAIAALEGEVGRMREGWEEMRNRCQVLYAWHAVGKMTDYGLHAAGCCPICDVVRAARATPAGEGRE